MISTLTLAFEEFFSFIDYKQRDRIIRVTIVLLNSLIQKLEIYQSHGFDLTKISSVTVKSSKIVFMTIDCLQRGINLLIVPLVKIYKFLTQEVTFYF